MNEEKYSSSSQTWNNKSLSSGKSEQISNSREKERKQMEAWLPAAGMIDKKNKTRLR